MSSTLLVLTRAGHEEVERLLVKHLQSEPATRRDRLFQNLGVRNMIDQITETTAKLVEIYEDTGNARDEIAALGGQTAAGNKRVQRISRQSRDYHRRHPAGYAVGANEEHEALLKGEPHVEFTGEAVQEYLQKILEYLTCFFMSTEPFQDLDRIVLKALAALGLKTGGTIQQRAQRLFLTTHTSLDQLDTAFSRRLTCIRTEWCRHEFTAS